VARRYLTADDVRRLAAAGGPIVVDAETLATPHALSVAEELGVRIVTGAGGAYADPAPDRGPDAERARRSLPNLPEPADDDPVTSVVITAVGRNRPGVLAEITAALAQGGGSVHDISQKMIEGYFHMVLTVELPPGAKFGELKRCMECLGGQDDYVVRVMHERVFRFMHRI
jgi:ACT domain-containing protein